MTPGYGHADNKLKFDLVSGQPTKADADYDTNSALGVTIPAGPYISLRPIFLAGYARVVGDASFKGPFSGELKAPSSGLLLTDLTIVTLLLGGALEARLAWRMDDTSGVSHLFRTPEYFAQKV